MKRRIAGILVAVSCLAPPPAVAAEPAVTTARQPRVEVAFVLDTTGSMSGLIHAAKAKIWSIANQIVLGKPKPVVRMALVAYRDKGDAYVTRVFDLTDNIDRVYTELMKFQADGGGDRPENVNQALHDAVHKIHWSADRSTLRIVYLVGDSPPHNDYADVPTYDKIARTAIEKGIYVNTIQCGRGPDTRRIWTEIADRAEGTFVAIDQDGGVKDVPTPYDEELAELNRQLVETVVTYGRKDRRRRNAKLNEMAASYPAAAQAARAVYSASAGVGGAGDLLDAVRDSEVDLAAIERDLLPEEMQAMSVEQRTRHIADLQTRRERIHARIKTLAGRRAAYVNEHMSRNKLSSFDRTVMETLAVQAARKNITYTLPKAPAKNAIEQRE